MGGFIDLTGLRFGKLTVIRRDKNRGIRLTWECVCDCGKHLIVEGGNLRSGNSTSCGCTGGTYKHGHTGHGGRKSGEYNTWCKVKDICYRPSNTQYKKFGANGIRMCKRWKQSFIAFLNDMGNKPQHHALARKDNGQDFTPDNCYWRPKAFRPFEALYERAKKEIEKWHGHVRGLKFGLSYDEFIKFTETSACHYCGDVIHWVDNGRAPYNLDRKDNLKDYSTENCVVCCFECNATKGARFSYDEMLIVGKAVHEVKLGRLKNR